MFYLCERKGNLSQYGNITYSGKLSREKTFANFVVLCLFVKVFSAKYGGVASLVRHKRAIHESFLRENRIFHQLAKVFFLESFPLYSSSFKCAT